MPTEVDRIMLARKKNCPLMAKWSPIKGKHKAVSNRSIFKADVETPIKAYDDAVQSYADAVEDKKQLVDALNTMVTNLGKITVGTELGWGEAVLRKGVTYGRQGVLAAAINHGQLAGKIEPISHHADGTQRCAAIVDFECYVPAPFAGHYEEVLPCGTRVKTGDIVGRLHDFARIDEPGWPVRAQVDGIVVGQAWAARVRQGQFILCVGREQPWPM